MAEKKRKISELTKEEEMQALQLHHNAIFIDGADVPALSVWNEAYLESIRQGGLTCGVKTVVISEVRLEKYTRVLFDQAQALRKIGDCHRLIHEHSDRVLLATSVADIERAKREGKYAMLLAFQDPTPIGGEDVTILHAYYALGLRVMMLSYNRRTLLADGCGEKTNAGLSRLGVQVVEEMNRLGMVIDLTHVGRASTLETIELSKHPVIFSHSNVRALVDSPINKTDEEITALARKGGVIGACASAPRLKKGGEATIEDFLDHIDYMVNLAGEDHVGIGLDVSAHYTPEHTRLFQIINPQWSIAQTNRHTAQGLEQPNLYPNITKGLIARNYSGSQIEKILGLNFIRVFRTVFGK